MLLDLLTLGHHSVMQILGQMLDTVDHIQKETAVRIILFLVTEIDKNTYLLHTLPRCALRVGVQTRTDFVG